MGTPNSEGDAALLEDELCAVEAIFGEDCTVSQADRCLTVCIPSKATTPHVELCVRFPVEGYPSQVPPEVEVLAPHLSEGVLQQLERELDDLFLPGEVRFCAFLAPGKTQFFCTAPVGRGAAAVGE